MAREGISDARYIAVRTDALDITTRVKEVDPSYFIMLNRKTGRFEVHSSAQGPASLCLVLPYDSLDGRTPELLRKTRGERAEFLFREMEKDNQLADARCRRRLEEAAGQALENAGREKKHDVSANVQGNGAGTGVGLGYAD